MGKYRSYTTPFKLHVVLEALSGDYEPVQICAKYNISSKLLKYWIKQFTEGKLSDTVSMEDTRGEDRCSRLHQLLGIAHEKIAMLEKALMHCLKKTRTDGSPNSIPGAFSGPEEGE